MNQSFARFVISVFEDQAYPDLTKYPAQWQGIASPKIITNTFLLPYDMAGWTLPYQMGVKVLPVNTPLKLSGKME